MEVVCCDSHYTPLRAEFVQSQQRVGVMGMGGTNHFSGRGQFLNSSFHSEHLE